jgi:DNA-directed RNA polymerase sigma subunit (sigma70/sigma32)
MARTTKAQRVFAERFGNRMPPQPRHVTPRNYRMMFDHLVQKQSYEDISTPHRIERERVRQIVERGLEWAHVERMHRSP